MEEGQAGGTKRLLYDQAVQRVATNDPSRDIVNTYNTQHTVFLTFMNYNNWPRPLTFNERLSQKYGGDEAHSEFWFSEQSDFPRIAVSSMRGSYRPSRFASYNPLSWIDRIHQWVWTGPTVGDGVFCRVRDFTNPHYKYYGLPLTPNEIDRLFMFSFEQDGKPFNLAGNLRCWNKHTYKRTSGQKWYCAELMYQGLKKSGVLNRLLTEGRIDAEFASRNPGSVTPAMLYENLCAPGKNVVMLTDNQVLGQTLADQHFNGPINPTPVDANTSESSLNIVRTSRRKPSRKGKRR